MQYLPNIMNIVRIFFGCVLVLAYFNNIRQADFIGTEAVVYLAQFQRSNSDEYEKMYYTFQSAIVI